MSLTEDIADELAKKTMVIIGGTDDNELVNDVATAIGASSATLQEAYLTAMRIRRAENRAFVILDKFEKDGPKKKSSAAT